MDKNLSAMDKDLYKRVDEVLHYIWDPAGISHQPHSRDEYERYIPQVFHLLQHDESLEAIVNYLLFVEEEDIGINPDHANADRTAEILYEHMKKVRADYPATSSSIRAGLA